MTRKIVTKPYLILRISLLSMLLDGDYSSYWKWKKALYWCLISGKYVNYLKYESYFGLQQESNPEIIYVIHTGGAVHIIFFSCFSSGFQMWIITLNWTSLYQTVRSFVKKFLVYQPGRWRCKVSFWEILSKNVSFQLSRIEIIRLITGFTWVTWTVFAKCILIFFKLISHYVELDLTATKTTKLT